MSRIHEGMFTSERLDWETPQAFFDLVNEEFNFTLGAAATPANAKCEAFWSEAEDALVQRWDGVVWCNPPYGRQIGRWIEKGFDEAQLGSTVVMLIPARTDTAYWHDVVMRAAEVRLIRGRLVFGRGEAASNAPFPCALIVFRQGDQQGPHFSTATRGRVQRRRPKISGPGSPAPAAASHTG